MDNKLKSYKLSPQLKAEVRSSRKRSSGRLSFNSPRIDYSNVPWKMIARIAAVLVVVLGGYLGIKAGYEKAVYAAEQKQIAQQQEYEQKLSDMKSEISSKSDNAYELVNMSTEYLKQRDGQRAEIAALLATEKEPNWRDGFINLGHIYLSVNKFDKAKESLAKAIEIDPLSGQAHYLLFLAHQELKDENAAKQEFAKARQYGYETEIGG